MPWLTRDADRHRCPRPEMPRDARSGDVWQCPECLTKYEVRSDQREGPYFVEVRGG